MTVLVGPGKTWNRCTKLNCTTPPSDTQVPLRSGGRYMSDCADSGTAAAMSKANEACLITDPPWCSFRIPQLLYRHSCTHLSYSTGVTFPCASTSIPEGSRYA